MSWNAPFKARVRQHYEDWMLKNDRPVTEGGNPAAPSLEIYLQWAAESWEHLPSDIIVNSSEKCGVTVALDEPIPSGARLNQESQSQATDPRVLVFDDENSDAYSIDFFLRFDLPEEEEEPEVWDDDSPQRMLSEDDEPAENPIADFLEVVLDEDEDGREALSDGSAGLNLYLSDEEQ